MRFIVILACSMVLLSSWQAPKTARIFGKGVISTEAPEFATTFNADQTEVFFNRTSADRSSIKIMYAIKEGAGWSKPVPLPFSTGEYLDVDPFLTKDGSRLYFSSDRPVTGTEKLPVLNTWYVQRSTRWARPVLADPPLNSDSTEIFITLADNRNAYFVSERESRGIVKSVFRVGDYQPSEPITLKLRGEEIYASNPAIAPDESFLIVAARDPEGNGSPDLFITFKQAQGWSELINLGPEVNSAYADFAPGLSKNAEKLYFTSERPGVVGPQEKGIRPPGDIYEIELRYLLKNLRPN